ncbi:MAG: alpha/beta hydrolase [Bacteroidetes bacterium]|nr:alpha/beta hydrolase [Bacteroidota bacterium]
MKEKYSTPESKFLNTEGMELHYRVTGSGPPLVLLHGVASSLHTWHDWHNLLSDAFTVISMDVPGFGLTGPHPKGDYTVGMYVRVLNDLFDHLKFDRVFMAGNSFGGFLTWTYAVEEPKRVRKIIIQDAAGFNTKFSDISDVGFMLATHNITRKLTWSVTPKSLIKASIRNATTPHFMISDQIIDRYYELLLRKGNRKAFSEILRKLIFNETDNTEYISKVNAPTLIQWGEQDTLVDIGYAYQFERAIKHSKLISYPGTGHLPMEEVAERSASDARHFFEEK